jgi:chromosome segregation ATPase
LQIFLRRARELSARRDRLEAELNPERARDLAQPASGSAGADPDTQAIVGRERALMQARATALEEQLASLQRTTELYGEEIASLRVQIQASEQQLRAVERELEEIRALVGRQLAPTSRLTLLERTVAQIISERQLLQTAIIRARQNISLADRARATLLNDRRQEILDELRKLDTEEAENQRRIETARNLVTEAQQTTPLLAHRLLSARSRSYRYEITRNDGAEPHVETTADVRAPLMPGDVVHVLEIGAEREFRPSAGAVFQPLARAERE